MLRQTLASPATRAGVSAVSQRLTPAVSRPLTMVVRAYQDDAKKEEQKQTQDVAVAKQAPAQQAVAPRMRAAVRLPSLFHEMQREMDAMTRAFGLPSFLDDDFFAPWGRSEAGLQSALPKAPLMHLATDITETDQAFIIQADAPGMSKEDIKVSVMHNTLTISGERSEESSTGGEGADKKTPVRYERSYGSFSRSFTLPPHVDTDAITATAKEGVLTVTIPKKPEQKPQPKEIAVE